MKKLKSEKMVEYMTSNLVTLTDFKKKKELEKDTVASETSEEEYMYDALDKALDACEELADDAIVILMVNGVMVSGSTDNDKELLKQLLAMTLDEIEGLEE
jgi:chaperonin cofactor prefoldin